MSGLVRTLEPGATAKPRAIEYDTNRTQLANIDHDQRWSPWLISLKIKGKIVISIITHQENSN